jgi:hypothetical protein
MSGTRRKAGWLGPQIGGCQAWLAHQGYTPATVRNMLKDLGQVGVWMSGAGLEAIQLDENAMAAFLASRRAAGRRRTLGPRAMIQLLSYLRDAGVIPAAKPPQTLLGRCWVSTGPGWSGRGAWRRPRCCVMRTPPAVSCSNRQWPMAC